MAEEPQFGTLIARSFRANIVASVCKYASLMYGIANVVGDDPHIDRVIYAGLGYVVGEVVGSFSRGVLTEAIVEQERYKLDTLIEKLDVPEFERLDIPE